MNTQTTSAPAGFPAGIEDIKGLRRLAARLVRDDADADDVVQESLLLGLRRAAGRAVNMGAWLRGVVRNKARESQRSSARREVRESAVRPGVDLMDPIDVAVRLEVHEQLVAAVKGLSEPYRSAVWLHYIEGREASDIARDSGTNVETVRTHLKRGVKQLREDIDRRHGGKRADWVPAVAAFAGVQPSLTLLATSAVGVASLIKPIAAVAAVLLVVATSVVVYPKVVSKTADASTPTGGKSGESGRGGRISATGGAANESTGGSVDDAATAGRSRAAKISSLPFADATASAGSVDSTTESGSFEFHYQQGFSFASRSVTDDLADADLVFKNCAGGISSVTLEAVGGAIVNLRCFASRFPKLKYAEALGRSVVKCAPTSIGTKDTAEGDSREPTSDAFLLRTRYGRFVVLAITGRGESGSWTEQPVSVSYVSCEPSPIFRPGTGDVTVEGIEADAGSVAQWEIELSAKAALAAEEAARALEERQAPFKRRLAELDRATAAMEPAIRARDGVGVRVAAVLDRSFAAPMGGEASYIAATYSFEKATRDDAQATGNDWDIVLDGSFGVRTVTDDRSLVFDLGSSSFAAARIGDVSFVAGTERAPVVAGRLYAVHTLDTETDQWALFRVEEIVSGESAIFSWALVERPEALAAALEDKSAAMKSGVARLQIRGGAGGGNTVKIYLDGSGERIDAVSVSPLDLAKPLDIYERHTAFVSGGRIPGGMLYVIERIEYVAQVQGDSNGPGSFQLQVGPLPVANVRENRSRDAEAKAFHCFGIDRGVRTSAADDMPIRGNLAVHIELRPGEESEVFAAIANSSWADVTLSGRLVPEDAQAKGGKRGRLDQDLLWTLELIAGAADEAGASIAARGLSKESAVTMRSFLKSIPAGAWRDRLSGALEHAPR